MIAKVLIPVLILGVCATACDEDKVPASEIVLASVYNTSGAQAILDVPSSNGSTLATSEINADGGVLSRKMSLVPVNGNSVPATDGDPAVVDASAAPVASAV